MKIIKGFFVLLIVWAICLFLLFGPATIHHIGVASREITDLKELNKFEGYVVKKLQTDIFGNWVIARKGRETAVFRCDDLIFKSLSISDPLGK